VSGPRDRALMGELARRPLRVMLCDDAPDLRALVRLRLEADRALRVVGEADDADAAARDARAADADVVVLDLDLPGAAGAEAVERVREAAPAAAVIVYSGTSEREAGAAAAVADGYLEKGVADAALPGEVRRLGLARRAERRRGG
jgi:DNA-binding NarL/FixJ family response regulator